jgi:hypothetical protein
LIPRIVRIGRYFGIVMIRADPIDAIDPTDRPRSCRAAQLPQHPQFCKIIFFPQDQIRITQFAKLYFSTGSDPDHTICKIIFFRRIILRIIKILGSQQASQTTNTGDHVADHESPIHPASHIMSSSHRTPPINLTMRRFASDSTANTIPIETF